MTNLAVLLKRAGEMLLARRCAPEADRVLAVMADVNFLRRFRDVHRHIDRSLDARDRREFVLACQELRNLVTRLRDVIDTASVSDIATAVERHASAPGS